MFVDFDNDLVLFLMWNTGISKSQSNESFDTQIASITLLTPMTGFCFLDQVIVPPARCPRY